MKVTKKIFSGYRFFILILLFLSIGTISTLKAEPILKKDYFFSMSSVMAAPVISVDVNPFVRYFPPGDRYPSCLVLLFSNDLSLERFNVKIVLRQPILSPRYPDKTWRGRLDSVWLAQSFCNLRNQPMLA